MAVKIGHAGSDENGNTYGGQAGDQTGREVYMRDWWLHDLGWRVLRCKDAAKREKMAQDMEWACENNNIGYDQWQNETLYQEASKVGFDCRKVTKPCETDCSRLIRVCILYAGINVPVFYTGTEAATLLATGQFEELKDKKYTESSAYLLRGDILVTKTTGHTVMVLTNGSKITDKEPEPKPANNIMYAESFDKKVAGTYLVTTALNLRRGAGTNYGIVAVLPQGVKVQNYGYYTMHDGTKWLYVAWNGKTGFCSSKYLKKG